MDGAGDIIRNVIPNDSRRQAVREEIERLSRALASQEGVRDVILFGSWAWGQPHEWSDIDLLVIRQTNESFWKRAATLYEVVEPREPVDFLVLTPAEFQERLQLHDPFFERVVREGRSLHAA